MLPVTADSLRIFLHILGATVWVGGQLVLATLVPVLRRTAPDAVRPAARRFQLIAWPAYGLLLATGIWNLAELGLDQSSEWLTTLTVKLALVALSGIAAAGHAFLTGPMVARAEDEPARSRRRALSGATAAIALLAALGATFLGTLL